MTGNPHLHPAEDGTADLATETLDLAAGRLLRLIAHERRILTADARATTQSGPAPLPDGP